MIPQDLIAAVQASHTKFWPAGPFVSVTLAQWAIESGFGKHQSGVNNFFGIKATAAQVAARHATQRLTNEYVNGQLTQIADWFANYDTLEEGIDAHASLLVTPRYARCQNAQTPEDYCQALQACGYATAPNYAATLIATISASDLKQYDQKPDKPASPADVPASPGGEGQSQMGSNSNFTIANLLDFFEHVPFAEVAAVVKSGGTNIPADIALGKALMDDLMTHFFNGGSAASAQTLLEAHVSDATEAAGAATTDP